MKTKNEILKEIDKAKSIIVSTLESGSSNHRVKTVRNGLESLEKEVRKEWPLKPATVASQAWLGLYAARELEDGPDPEPKLAVLLEHLVFHLKEASGG